MESLPGQVPASSTPPAGQAGRLGFARPRQFYVKSAILLLTTVALVPILLLKDERWATAYLVILIVLHLLGPIIVFWGMSWRAMLGNRRTLALRALGVTSLLALLYLASMGLQDQTRGAIFWASLFLVWALHTGALALLHIRGTATASSCPFV